MAIHLIPREASFDDLIEGLSARLPRASSALGASGEPPEPGEAHEAVWRMVERLDKTFLTPFDREDIYRLADALAWAEEAIVEAARRVFGHEPDREAPGIEAAIAAVGECAAKVDEAVRTLRDLQGRSDALRGLLGDVDRWASGAVRALRGVDDRLEPDRDDLMAMLRRRDLRAALGRALDALRDAGRAATTILVKGA